MNELNKERLVFESSISQRNFEITHFWRRAWFFGALLVALSGGYVKLLNDPKNEEYAIYLIKEAIKTIY